MEDILTFEKGLIPEFEAIKKIPGSYLNAINKTRNRSGDIIDEPGISIVHDLGANYKVVGAKNVNDYVVFASTDGVNSELGKYVDGTYTVLVNNTILGFSKDNRVWMESKVDYKGDTVLYVAGKGIKLRAINLDDIPTTDFDQITGLFLKYALPVCSLNGVFSGGSVPTGSYQFAVRLVTESNNTTAFGPVSGVIPIANEVIGTYRKDYDGADPQSPSPNAISIDIKNIDKTFAYIEPCVITYLGGANVLSIKSLGKIAINGQDEMTITYSGAQDDQEEIASEELGLNTTLYDEAGYITQKDSTLILANVKEDSSPDDYDWQAVASSIEVRYVEHEVVSREDTRITDSQGVPFEDIADWKYNCGDSTWQDTGAIGNNEDYKNPETCSKFTGYRRGEVYSLIFTPIFKGGRKGYGYHIPAKLPANVVDPTNLLDMVSAEDYEYGAEFGALAGEKVRYFKMPENDVSPFCRRGNSDDEEIYTILGISAKITATGWEDLLDGYIISRENRTGFETKRAQGIVKRTYKLGHTSGRDDGLTEGFEDKQAVCPIPGVGTMKILNVDRASHPGPVSLGDQKVGTFHAPDLVHEASVGYVPTKLQHIMTMNTRVKQANTGRGTHRVCKGMFRTAGGTMFNDMYNLEGFSQIPTESLSPTDDPRSNEGNVNLSRVLFGDTKFEYRRIMECHAIKTTEDLPIPYKYVDRFGDIDHDPDATYWLEGMASVDDYFELELFNVITESRNYYGDVYNKTGIPINTVLFSVGSTDPRTGQVLPNTESVSFRGDTFISRYAYTFRDTVPFYGAIGGNQIVPKADHTVYFSLESNYNYNLRHYNDGSDGTGSVPYYPKFKVLQGTEESLHEFLSVLGHPVMYNKHYSVPAGLVQPTFTKDIGEQNITEYPNRSPYSATSVEGEKFDAFRLFLPNNYHDIPKQYGNITGMFVQGNDLMYHTERALWRAFYNALATQATSLGEVILGNGGAFNRPSVPVVTADGGYAGCLDQAASIQTPAGRYFIDAVKAKMFALTSEGLREVSHPSIYSSLRSNIYKQDLVGLYDSDRSRVIFNVNNYTISYSIVHGNYESFHSYGFDKGITLDLKELVCQGSKIGYYDPSKVLDYFGIKAESMIAVPSVVSPTISKRYTSVYVILDANGLDGRNLPREFFTQFRAYSLERNTSKLNLVVARDADYWDSLTSVHAYKENNKWRISFPQDQVFDMEGDIFDPENLVNHANFGPEDKEFLSDMIDNHVVLEFYNDNLSPKVLRLRTIIANFDENKS